MSVASDIKSASDRCNGRYNVIPSFWHMYSFNTENIAGYSNYFDLNNRSLLTVGSSGEQAINAHLKGAKDITLYDLCPFAKYYTWLKIAAICALDYEEYQYFFFRYTNNKLGHGNNVYRFSNKYFSKIAPFLKEFDYESFYYWSELLKKVKHPNALNILFKDEEMRVKVIKGYSLYLNSEEDYLKAKKVITDISFKYIHGDLFTDHVPENYDNIWLSDICSNTSVYDLLFLIKKLDKNLNINGKMLFAYLHDINYDVDNNDEEKTMYNMPFVRDYFKDYISEYQRIKSAREINWDVEKDKGDLILIHQKKIVTY